MTMPAPLRLGLTGFPLRHSFSPLLHQSALSALGITGQYDLYPAQTLQELTRLVARLRLPQEDPQHLDGLNVTIPHKTAMIPLLDELTITARMIGAINTVFLQDDKLIGDNTDAPGFWQALERFAVSIPEPLTPPLVPQALVLGAGGSARAIVYALQGAGASITLAARRVEQASALAYDLTGLRPVGGDQGGNQIEILPWSDIRGWISRYPQGTPPGDQRTLWIINTTPIGMSPNPDSNPWPIDTPFPSNARVYDLVYNPPQTQLVRAALEAGIPATNGLGMLIAQAALAFARWSGCSTPVDEIQDIMWASITAYLSEKS